MKGYHAAILFSAVVFFKQPCLAQGKPDQELKATLSRLNASLPCTEKMFVHTDRSLYIAGENIWFKAYCLQAATKLPSTISRAAYVEILNLDDQPVVRKVIRLSNGCGQGLIKLPDNLSSGNYCLRAYTAWMKNTGPGSYFMKQFRIFNPFQIGDLEDTISAGKTIDTWDAKFYPEGGVLLASAENRIFFAVLDSYGRPAKASGQIIDQFGKALVDFESDSTGIGSLSFIPEPGKDYKAILKTGGGQKTIHLPALKDNAWLLQLKSHTGDEVELLLNHPAAVNGNEAHIATFSDGKYKYLGTIELSDSTELLHLSSAQLNSGVSHIIVFDPTNTPVCFLPVFRPDPGKEDRSQPSTVHAVIKNLQPVYGHREKVSLSVDLQNISQVPHLTDLSVAVVMDDHAYPGNDPSLTDYLIFMQDYQDGWLWKEIMDTGDPEASDLQLARLANGQPPWVFQPMPPKDAILLPDLDGIVLSGSLRNKTTLAPVANQAIWFSWVGGNRDIRLVHCNEAGRFFFRLPAGEGSREAIIQVPAAQDDVILQTDDQFTHGNVPLHRFAFSVADQSKSYLEQLLLNYQVSAAYKRNNAKTEVPSAGKDFFGHPDQAYELDNYIKLPVMEEFFRELVKSTLLIREKGVYKINVLDGNLNRIIGPDPGYLIDGVPVFRSSTVLGADPEIFKDIRVITGRYLYDNLRWDGIVDLTTRKGDFSDFDQPAASVRLNLQLLEPRSAFQPVQYDTDEAVSSRLPDYRTLLLWKPDLTADQRGIATIDFTTPDVSGQYKIVIQGITHEGVPVFLEQRFQVTD
jgi:hypothetical protein